MAVEILVEITASPTVTLRGSDRRKVLSDGTNWGNFAVHDAALRLRANEFGRPGQRPPDWLDVSFGEIDGFHEAYDLSGKAVVVRIGSGDGPEDFRKGSGSGSRASPVYIWRGNVPTNWTPAPSRDRSRCRLYLSGPLSYKSFPVLTDRIDSESAPVGSQGRLFPILFGDSVGRSVGTELFPMTCIGRVGSDLAWAMGNLSLQGGVNAFSDVFFNPYTEEISRSDSQDEARALWIGGHLRDENDNKTYHDDDTLLWYSGSGITTTNDRPVLGQPAGELVGYAGWVIYWLLRHKADQPAGALDWWHLTEIAPPQFGQEINVYAWIERPQETADLIGELAREYGVIIRQIDGNRKHGEEIVAAGDTPVWSVADRFVLEPSSDRTHSNLPRPIDPGWLLKDPSGGDDIRILGPHPLYANRVNMLFGEYPFVLKSNRKTHLTKHTQHLSLIHI